MKSKRTSGDFREDNDGFKGKKKHKLTPVKKQKSKRTQFLDEIEELDDEDLYYKPDDLEDLFDDLEDYDDDEEDDF